MDAQRHDRRVHNALLSALSSVQAKAFATRGTFSAKDSSLDLGFTVRDIGEIKLPLEPDDAAWDKLKEKGQSTIHATWEIDAAEVSFVKQPLWNAWLDRMMSTVKKSFGVADDDVVIAEPYKLLVYEKDSQVEPGQGFAKPTGSFATLTVSLRSYYQGANVHISHIDHKKTFSTDKYSWDRYQWLAWYADAVQEMKPVVFGVRLVLTYILRFTNLPPTHLVYDERDEKIVQERVKRVLERWTGKPTMLWYVLKQKYPNHFVSQASLQDDDVLHFQILKAACQSLGYTILLGQLVRDYWEDSDDEEWNSHEDEQWVKHIVDANDIPYCSKLELVQSEIVQKYPLCTEPNEDSWTDISPGLYEEMQSSERHPAITFLKQQALQSRKHGVQALDPDLQSVIQALLDDFNEYGRANHVFPIPKSMFLTDEELETIALFVLKVGWNELFRDACRIILNRSGFNAARTPKLTDKLGLRMYVLADVDHANCLLGMCTKYTDIIEICEKLMHSYHAAEADLKTFPAPVSVDCEYWRQLWYRVTISKWSWPLWEEDFQAMKHFPRLLNAGQVVGDPSVTSEAYSSMQRYLKSKHGIPGSEILQIWKSFSRLHKQMPIDQAQNHYFAFLDAVHEASKGRFGIVIGMDDIEKLIQLGSELGTHAVTKLKTLVHPECYNRSLHRTLAFVRAARDHECWHHYLADMLCSTVDHLFYYKKTSRWNPVSETDVRCVPPFKRISFFQPSPTIAEIKFLVRTVQELRLDTIWSRLQCKLSFLAELDLEEFADITTEEELTQMKEDRKDEVKRSSFGFTTPTITDVTLSII
ncbi:uncharacterized protein N0V89_000378 [Didymosphaeria variabile]|uniref:Uncharacterized protein n=1 Tax=Didymosphaeria variabile TaxID=1932322 RepID=A0A9W9CFP1_9PLEO|nr:uncharacterized protein N0V89_000378 [Didymosphaeria variabile]KAJ4359822.1 hypothetical protein N0V89_000378 [Didymosphaeria variabile]